MAPSKTHEGLAELVRQDAGAAVRMFAHVDRVPRFAAAVEGSPDLSQAVPVEQHADAVVVLNDDDGKPVFGIVVEVQLSVTKAKRQSWSGYLYSLQTRLRGPVALLVICTRRNVATWARKPITWGPGLTVTPSVLGPDQIPAITDPEQASGAPELTLLSAITRPDDHDVLDALLATLDAETEQGLMYADLVRTVLPEDALKYLEDQMTTSTWRPLHPENRKYFDAGEAKGRVEGKAEGQAKDVLAVLGARGITVPSEVHDRVTTCTDTEQLSDWLIRAATGTTLADVFD